MLWLLGVVIVSIIFYWYRSVPVNLPPGSAGIPILGYIPFMNRKPYRTFVALGKAYGNLYYLYFGRQLIIILNDFRSIKQAFILQGDVFSGRPSVFKLSSRHDDNLGITSTEGEYWQQHRRFIIKNLKNCGVTDLTNEPLMLEEINYLMKELRTQIGQPIAVKNIFIKSLVNNVIIFVFGNRLKYDDPILNDILKYLDEIIVNLPNLCFYLFFPWIKWIPYSETLFHKKKIRKCNEMLLKIINNLIDDMKKQATFGENNNYIHAYLNEQHERMQKGDDTFSDSGLAHNVRDLLGAGTETSATTLLWAMLYMTLHPIVQKKVQKELDLVIGRHRNPSWTDRINTPYTQATLCELQRIVSLSPLGIQRRTIKDTLLFGYHIPADAMVIPVIYNVHHDPEIWSEPNQFRPQRFLGTDGQVIKLEQLIPFSVGKRACAGERLAQMELYLYFTSLLLNFDFIPHGDIEQTLQSTPGLTRQPKCNQICVRERPLQLD